MLCSHRMHQMTNIYSDLPVESNTDGSCKWSDTHCNTPPIDSTLNERGTHGGYNEINKEEQLVGYSAITDTATNTTSSIEDGPYNHTHHGPTAPSCYCGRDPGYSEARDTSNDGLVYSAVVRQDGIKTTVKTTVFKD